MNQNTKGKSGDKTNLTPKVRSAKPVSKSSRIKYFFGEQLKQSAKGVQSFQSLPPERRREALVGLKVSESEKKILSRLSKLHSCSVSDVLRLAVRTYIQSHDADILEASDINKNQLHMFD
jgi:hypothetical protein